MVGVVFLDVGAHEGQTLEEVVKPRYGFEHIFAFEPMPRQHAILVERFGSHPAVTVFNYGLSDHSGPATFYGGNEKMETSLYPSKVDVDEREETPGEVVSASEFFEERVAPWEHAVVKLNCEGAEIAILDDLLESGKIWRCANVMIDFDTRKVAGREGEEARVIDRLDAARFADYCLCEDVFSGKTHQDRIRSWLDGVLPSRP